MQLFKSISRYTVLDVNTDHPTMLGDDDTRPLLVTRARERPNLGVSFPSQTASHCLIIFPIYTPIAAMTSGLFHPSDAPKYPPVGLSLNGAPRRDHALLVRISVRILNIPQMPPWLYRGQGTRL